MKNITVSVDDRLTSKGQAGDPDLESRRRLLQETFKDFDARGVGLRMSDNLSREELYDRHHVRAATDAAGPDKVCTTTRRLARRVRADHEDARTSGNARGVSRCGVDQPTLRAIVLGWGNPGRGALPRLRCRILGRPQFGAGLRRPPGNQSLS